MWTSYTFGLLNLGLGYSREMNKIYHTANRRTGHYSAKVVPETDTNLNPVDEELKDTEAVMFFGKCKAASLDKKF